MHRSSLIGRQTSPRSPLEPPPIATKNPFEKAVTEKTTGMPRVTIKSSGGASSARSSSPHSSDREVGSGDGAKASHQPSVSVQPLAASDPALNELMSTTLKTTASKLDQVERQRTRFEEGKASLLHLVDHEENPTKKMQILYDGFKQLPLMQQGESRLESLLSNVQRFLSQAQYDRSISTARVQTWIDQFLQRLDAQSNRYKYASFYKMIIEEWLVKDERLREPIEHVLETAKGDLDPLKEQRSVWEEKVFHALQTDEVAITDYLSKLLSPDRNRSKQISAIKDDIAALEKSLTEVDQFDSATLGWCISGLLRSDLLTNEKRQELSAIQMNPTAMRDLGDDLNLRMRTLDRWAWSSEGVKAEQRKQVSSHYRVFHNEALIDSLLLRYIGVKWSVQFFKSLRAFSKSKTWYSPGIINVQERQKWEFYNGKLPGKHSVRHLRYLQTTEDYFLSKLLRIENEVDRGYDFLFQNGDKDKKVAVRKSVSELNENLLHLIQTEINLSLRLSGATTVLRSDFESFGPSLPHSSIFAVLKFFGVSKFWIQFFQSALEVPINFEEDGPEAKPRIRKRGTPMSSPLADVFSEVVLFVMDYAVDQRTKGSRLYRLHDDLWFWGPEAKCVEAWTAAKEFANLMGLNFNAEKTGSFRISYKDTTPLNPILPQGDVRWGWLILNKAHGHFVIDHSIVGKHTASLEIQLNSCKSLLSWIQVWNSYAVRFFTAMMGTPANCFGQPHIKSILSTFERVQKRLFPQTNGNVTAHVKKILMQRFDMEDIPDGFLYYPVELGGLGLLNPFIPLLLLQPSALENPDSLLTPETFFADENDAYEKAKEHFEDGQVKKPDKNTFVPSHSEFMSFEEYTQHRADTSVQLLAVYEKLLSRPEPSAVHLSKETEALLKDEGDRDKRDESVEDRFSAYELWVIDLYKEEMVQMFGGLCVVEQGLLPMGMVNMARSLRIKWQD